MTEQEKIEQAAKKVCDEMEFIAGISRKPNDQDVIDSFKAGASFYEEKIMPGKMADFAEWAALKYDKSIITKDIWSEKESRVPYATKELLEQYFEHLKHNQDATK